MKMRFWQKTYIFTLIIFLVCLNIGILAVAVYTYNRSVKAEEDTAFSQQYYIAMCVERDYDDLSDYQKNKNTVRLMTIYGELYASQGYYIEFRENENIIYSNFGSMKGIDANHIMHKDIYGKRHIILSRNICEEKYIFVFGKNVEELNDEYRSLMIIYVITAMVVSVFMALVLFLLLRKLSSPLDKLRGVTESIAQGDFDVRAEETGFDEFTALARSFNSMLEKIKEQMQSLKLNAEKKQMLVDNLAHELRTPLTSIYGYAELLQKASMSNEDKAVAWGYIMSESKRLEKISEILLDEAYMRGNLPNMIKVDVFTIAADTVRRLGIKSSKNGVELCYRGDSFTTLGNEILLSMLLYNLIDNGIKACENGGKVEIICSNNGCIFIKDTGKGMSEEQLLHITEPFYRTDTSRSRAEGGAGLGLSLCKTIADIHGIKMEFISELKKGTEVRLYFTS